MTAFKILLFITITNFVDSRHIQFHLNGYECFYQEIREKTKCSVEYAPISGSRPHVDVTIEDPNQYVFYRKNQQEYDFYKFETNATGTYRVCFSNIYDLSMYSNIVYLDFVVGDEGNMVRLDAGASTTPMTQVETSIVNIYDAMKVVELYQNHHRIREANGRLVGSSLNEKVMMWSLGQSAIIVIIGAAQVYILRQFFSSRKEEI
ncbi:transmembrane emp24 domain-containing protein 7 [Hydra vulgaris]|uniref:Transmembrane emp24 domain-containing protein 7 n=1 Tax=Hydra vulgaris TaxID=6087 RepID=A0ABM4C239_HYDVU|nr:transmembrane emp24 domain-containing protein 7 [Hydra vulgaris]